jgi:peptidyl-prolyl cis-trans isomerase SurA
MKRILFIALVSLSFSLSHITVLAQEKQSPPINQAPIVPVNGIAIVVNDEVITKQELQERAQMIEQRLKAQGVALPPHAELQKQIIERLIVEKAQLQLARDLGLRVDDTMLDRAIARIAEQNKMSMQTFRNQVEKEGLSYVQFREGVREDILMQRLLEREVDGKVQVSELEVDNYLSAQKESKQKNQEIEIAQILIRVPENATPDALTKLQARAENILQQVKAGGDFSQLAVTYSDSTEGLKGGSLGWRDEARYPQLFIDAIDKLNVGDTTGLLRSANGFHILKLTGKRNNDQPVGGIQQAHVRHILIKVTPTITKEQAKQKLLELKLRIQNDGASFEDLAKQFSSDGTATKGGDLGWLHPGDVPELDPIISSLKDGQISEPVETPFGLHLIQLVGRKTDDVSPERQRLLARQTIRARKLDEATLDWMRQLRDQAYVEIRDH